MGRQCLLLGFKIAGSENVTEITLHNGTKIQEDSIPDGISCYVVIGGADVSADVISITGSLHSAQEQGAEPSKCTIVLHNGGNYYGTKIATGQFPTEATGQEYADSVKNTPDNPTAGDDAHKWAARTTTVSAIAYVARYDISMSQDISLTPSAQEQSDIGLHGVPTKTQLPYEKYPIFFGVISKSNYNHEIATIECECVVGALQPAMKHDYAWDSTDTLVKKLSDVVKDASEDLPYEIVVIDHGSTDKEEIHQDDYYSASYSFMDSIANLCKDHRTAIYSEVDKGATGDNVFRLILYSSSYHNGYYVLDPYVTDPGDTSSILRFANKVTVIPVGSAPITGVPGKPDKGTHDSDVLKTRIVMPDEIDEGDNTLNDVKATQDLYGIIEAPTIIVPTATTRGVAKQIAIQALLDYDMYHDAEIKCTVVTIVPPLLSFCKYKVPDIMGSTVNLEVDLATGDNSIPIVMKVLHKDITYDSSGLVCHLTGWRVAKAPDEGTDSTNAPTEQPKSYETAGAPGNVDGVNGEFYVDGNNNYYFSEDKNFNTATKIEYQMIPEPYKTNLMKNKQLWWDEPNPNLRAIHEN